MMFVANEPALVIAFQQDNQIYEKALDKNIVLVSKPASNPKDDILYLETGLSNKK